MINNINIGLTANDGTGDLLRTAFDIINGNFISVDVELANKPTLVNGLIPANLLPSFVDDVLEFDTISEFPLEGEVGKLYLDLTTNKLYRWATTVYVDVSNNNVDNATDQLPGIIQIATQLETSNGSNDTKAITPLKLKAITDNLSVIGHTHSINNVSGLQTALDGKSPTEHGHKISDITGLQTALDNKSSIGHTHSISNISGLQTALDGKVGSSSITSIWSGTQASYDALGTYSTTTIYIIT